VTWVLSGDVSVSVVIEVTEVGVDRTVGGMPGETGMVTGASTSVRGKVTVNDEIGGAIVTGVDGTGTAGVIGVGVEETVDVMMGEMGVMGVVGPTSDWVTAIGSAKVVVSLPYDTFDSSMPHAVEGCHYAGNTRLFYL